MARDEIDTGDPDHLEHELAAETVEPLGPWVHVQPSTDDERIGRIVLPASVGARLQRSMVLAAGDEVADLAPGDVVFVLGDKALDLRDGSRLVPREAIVARVRG